jgi:hypothetical protein
LTGWTENEALAEEWVELQEDALAAYAPFNLNDTIDLQRMLDAFLITEAEYRNLHTHLRRYGALLHFYELLHCGIFPADWIQRMEPFLSLESRQADEGDEYRVRMHSFRAELRTRLKQNAGDSLFRLISAIRLSGRLGQHTDMAMVCTKGAGEPAFAPGTPLQAEYFSAFVRWRGKGILRQCVMGDYALQGGIGLRYGKGWAGGDIHYPLADAVLPARMAARSSSIPSITLKGLATEWRMGAIRFHISSGAQHSDAYFRIRGGKPDWSEGSGGDHSTVRYAARREQGSLFRHSARLGIEKEQLRIGLSWDRLSVNGMEEGGGHSISVEEAAWGLDVQWAARHQELWLEAVRFHQARGIALSWIHGQSDWIRIRTGGSLRQGSLPLSSRQSILADVVHPNQLDLYAAAFMSWGKGWTLGAGLRNEQQWQEGGAVRLSSRTYLRLERKQFRSGNHSLLADLRFPERDGATRVEPGIQRIRLMYRSRIQTDPKWQWNGGWHLAADHSHPASRKAGLAWYLSCRHLHFGRRLQHFDASLAWHELDNAQSGAWFWFTGAEGRLMLQSLYGRGFRSSFSALWQTGEKSRMMAGISYRRSHNKEGEISRSLELGMRLQLQW